MCVCVCVCVDCKYCVHVCVLCVCVLTVSTVCMFVFYVCVRVPIQGKCCLLEHNICHCPPCSILLMGNHQRGTQTQYQLVLCHPLLAVAVIQSANSPGSKRLLNRQRKGLKDWWTRVLLGQCVHVCLSVCVFSSKIYLKLFL